MAGSLDAPVAAEKDPRQWLWEEATNTYGTARIFEWRERKFTRRLRWLTFFALSGPLIVGATAMGFGLGAMPLPGLIAIASAIGVVQVIVALWSLVTQWESSLAYASESHADNDRLSNALQDLVANPDDRLLATLKAETNSRRGHDSKAGIAAEEKRAGFRAGLLQFRRTCGICQKIPDSMVPSSCNTCGNFDKGFLK